MRKRRRIKGRGFSRLTSGAHFRQGHEPYEVGVKGIRTDPGEAQTATALRVSNHPVTKSQRPFFLIPYYGVSLVTYILDPSGLNFDLKKFHFIIYSSHPYIHSLMFLTWTSSALASLKCH